MARDGTGYVPGVNDDDDFQADDEDESTMDRLRQMPAGVSDPNIIGDAGPTDIPPGTDPVPSGEGEGVT